MIKRDLYLNRVISFKDKQLIKIITGMRRSGKSTLMLLFEEYLMKNNVSSKNIIHMNFESMEYDFIKDYKDLYVYIKRKLPNGRTYILLDEIQQIEKWEKAILSMTVDFDVDIYLTGSNAYLLSSELSTLLAGRYVEIKMFPLSFKEFLDFNISDSNFNVENQFNKYLKYGGLPLINTLDDNELSITSYLKDVYDAVIKKDIMTRNSLKDPALLENLTAFLAGNIGSTISPNKISNYISNGSVNPTNVTIENYLKMLESAFIIYKANRYDIKGKQLLKTLGKYYIVDTGIRNAVIGYRDADYGHVLENVVYLELLRRGYEVCTGKNGDYEIDFIASKEDNKKYYQVTLSLTNEDVMKRELRSLVNIPDNYEKIIITSDKSFIQSNEGIKYVNIIDFLLETE